MFKKFIKIIAAVLIFAVLFTTVQSVLATSQNTNSILRIRGFYELEEDSVDAIFLGSSATYAFWNAPLMWKQYGIPVYSYSSPLQSPLVAKELIKETRKTQPNAMYIVNLTSTSSELPVHQLHSLADNMPESLEKVNLVLKTGELFNYSNMDMLENLLPILRYHDRWNEIKKDDITKIKDEYMTGNTYRTYLKGRINATNGAPYPNTYDKLPEKTEAALNELMDYSQEENIPIFFVVVPQGTKDKEQVAQQLAAVDLVKERGFKVVNLRQNPDLVDIDYEKDFYDRKHTNIHGSIKVSCYISEYLMENFGLTNKQGQKKYHQWDEAWEKYYPVIEKYLKEKDMKYLTNIK